MPQSLANVVVHLIFSTKNRRPSITPEIREELNAYMTGILRNIGCQPIAIGGVEDHMHIVFGLTRTHTLAQIVEKLKTSSNKWVKEKWSGDLAWQSGYGAFSVGVRDVEQASRYVWNQESHHRTISFQEELRSVLSEHGIEFDERYVWD